MAVTGDDVYFFLIAIHRLECIKGGLGIQFKGVKPWRLAHPCDCLDSGVAP